MFVPSKDCKGLHHARMKECWIDGATVPLLRGGCGCGGCRWCRWWRGSGGRYARHIVIVPVTVVPLGTCHFVVSQFVAVARVQTETALTAPRVVGVPKTGRHVQTRRLGPSARASRAVTGLVARRGARCDPVFLYTPVGLHVRSDVLGETIVPAACCSASQCAVGLALCLIRPVGLGLIGVSFLALVLVPARRLGHFAPAQNHVRPTIMSAEGNNIGRGMVHRPHTTKSTPSHTVHLYFIHSKPLTGDPRVNGGRVSFIANVPTEPPVQFPCPKGDSVQHADVVIGLLVTSVCEVLAKTFPKPGAFAVNTITRSQFDGECRIVWHF